MNFLALWQPPSTRQHIKRHVGQQPHRMQHERRFGRGNTAAPHAGGFGKRWTQVALRTNELNFTPKSQENRNAFYYHNVHALQDALAQVHDGGALCAEHVVFGCEQLAH
jgi:hypothetical protein